MLLPVQVSSKSDESADDNVQTSGEKSAIHDDAVKKLENESLTKELDEELSIRAALYSVFFQSYADKVCFFRSDCIWLL